MVLVVAGRHWVVALKLESGGAQQTASSDKCSSSRVSRQHSIWHGDCDAHTAVGEGTLQGSPEGPQEFEFSLQRGPCPLHLCYRFLSDADDLDGEANWMYSG